MNNVAKGRDVKPVRLSNCRFVVHTCCRKNLFYWAAPLLLSSCSSLHISTGLIDPAFGGKFKGDAHHLSALYTTMQVEQPLETDNFLTTFGAGPVFTQPLDGRSPMYGLEVSNRLVWKATSRIKPFLSHAHGIHYHDTEWYWESGVSPATSHGSDSRYEFSTRVGAGILIQPTDRLTIDLSYQWVHFSSGTSMLGDKTRQFFHLSKADTNNGFEGGAIFIGVQYEW